MSSSTIPFYGVDSSVLLLSVGWKTEAIWIGGEFSSLGYWQWRGKSTREIDALPWGPDEPSGSGGNRCIICATGEDLFYDDSPCTSASYFACELIN